MITLFLRLSVRPSVTIKTVSPLDSLRRIVMNKLQHLFEKGIKYTSVSLTVLFRDILRLHAGFFPLNVAVFQSTFSCIYTVSQKKPTMLFI